LLDKHLGITYRTLSDDDPEWKKDKEAICFKYKGDANLQANTFIKVPFKEALSLIARR
jgi:hypothetical protein